MVLAAEALGTTHDEVLERDSQDHLAQLLRTRDLYRELMRRPVAVETSTFGKDKPSSSGLRKFDGDGLRRVNVVSSKTRTDEAAD